MENQINHFQYHGSIIYDERRKILEEAIYEPSVVKYEKYADGSFVKTKIESSNIFCHKGKIYYFLTTHHGTICNFFELNNSREKCIKEQYGVYYELI